MQNAGAGGSFVDLGSGQAFSSATGVDTVANIENVKGSDGNDGLNGNGGSNVFVATAGDDTIDGRDGVDTFDASAATAGVTIDLAEGEASGTAIPLTSSVVAGPSPPISPRSRMPSAARRRHAYGLDGRQYARRQWWCRHGHHQ